MYPVHVAGDQDLLKLVECRPITMESMKKLDGFSDKKSERLNDMLGLIRNFSIENNLETDVHLRADVERKTPNLFDVS